MERGPLIVERERMTGFANQRIELPVRQFERPEKPADTPRHFVDGQSVGGHRIPEAEESDVVDRALGLVMLCRDEQIAQLAKRPLDLKSRFEAFRPVCTVSDGDLLIELFLGAVTDQPLFADQPVHDTDGEGAAAEPEGEDVVALPGAAFLVAMLCFGGGRFQRLIVEMRAIIAARKLVDIEHVPLQTEAEGTAQDRERLEGRGADAVVIECDLLRTCKVQRFEYAPDIGAPDLAGGIAGAVREQDDPLVCHTDARSSAVEADRHLGGACEKFLMDLAPPL